MNARPDLAASNMSGTATYSCVAGSCVPFQIHPAVEMLTGHKLEEFRRCPQLWLNLVVPDDRQHMVEGLATLMREGFIDQEYRIVHASGRVRLVRNTAQLVHGAGANPSRIDGTITDITPERQAVAMDTRRHLSIGDTHLQEHKQANTARQRRVRRTDNADMYQRVEVLRRSRELICQTLPTYATAAIA